MHKFGTGLDNQSQVKHKECGNFDQSFMSKVSVFFPNERHVISFQYRLPRHLFNFIVVWSTVGTGPDTHAPRRPYSTIHFDQQYKFLIALSNKYGTDNAFFILID